MFDPQARSRLFRAVARLRRKCIDDAVTSRVPPGACRIYLRPAKPDSSEFGPLPKRTDAANYASSNRRKLPTVLGAKPSVIQRWSTAAGIVRGSSGPSSAQPRNVCRGRRGGNHVRDRSGQASDNALDYGGYINSFLNACAVSLALPAPNFCRALRWRAGPVRPPHGSAGRPHWIYRLESGQPRSGPAQQHDLFEVDGTCGWLS